MTTRTQIDTALRLEGQVAIVTGAGRGLGRAMAEALADAGASVSVASRSTAELTALVAEIESRGGCAFACPTDVTDEEAVEKLVSSTLDHFGRLDIVVNNSGIVATIPLIEQTPEQWDAVVDTNLRGTFLLMRAAGRHLIDQGHGKVINIASNFALQGVANHGAYSASKAGVIGLTKSAAIEWARSGIQVNAIAPGYFATPLNAELRSDEASLAKVVRAVPVKRMGEAEELKPWLLLLAGPESDFMTGEVIVIDGGQSVR